MKAPYRMGATLPHAPPEPDLPGQLPQPQSGGDSSDDGENGRRDQQPRFGVARPRVVAEHVQPEHARAEDDGAGADGRRGGKSVESDDELSKDFHTDEPIAGFWGRESW